MWPAFWLDAQTSLPQLLLTVPKVKRGTHRSTRHVPCGDDGGGSNGIAHAVPTSLRVVNISRIRPTDKRKVIGIEARSIFERRLGLPQFGASNEDLRTMYVSRLDGISTCRQLGEAGTEIRP